MGSSCSIPSFRPAVAAAAPASAAAINDNATERQPSIRGGGAPVFNANSIHAWFNRVARAFGLNCHPRVEQRDGLNDLENQSVHITAPPNIPSQQELLTLSQDFIEEENREINSGLKAQFVAIQKNMLESKNFSRMPDAQKLLIEMHELKQEDLDRGFERGGEIYSYRNIVGSMLSFAPLLLTYIKTQPEFKKDQGFQLKMAAGYFGSVLLTSCAAAAVNARVLLHCTPMQDAVFDGSPYVAPELDSKNTPPYQETKDELDAVVKLINDLGDEFGELQALQGDAHEDQLKVVHGLMAQIDQNKGVQHYTGRALLQRAYIEGLQRQSILQTGKVYGNLAAGWASFLKNDPRLGMYIQLAVGMAQIIGQRLVAPADQKQLQNNLFKVEISSRPLSGEDHHGDDQIIRGMLRTPREVRALNIQMLVQSHVEWVAQQIADVLGMDATDYKKYRSLQRKENDYKAFESLKNEIDQKRAALCHLTCCGSLGVFVDARSQLPEQSKFFELIAEVHRATGFKLRDIEKLIELERKVARNSLTEKEVLELAKLKDNLGSVISHMLPNDKEGFFGKRELLLASTCAARRRSSRNLAFESEVLSATFKTLSTRLSDAEILAEIILKLAEKPEVRPATMHVSNGRIVVPFGQKDCQAGETFLEMPTARRTRLEFDKMKETITKELKISQAEFDELIGFINNDTDNQSLASGSEKLAKVQKTRKKLENALAELDSEKILEIWGVTGLEAELIRATRSKNYCREEDFYKALEDNLKIRLNKYKEYHRLRMRCQDSGMRNLDEDERRALDQCTNSINNLHPIHAERNFSSSVMARLAKLEEEYAEIEDDPLYIIERRFEKVSDDHKKLVIDGMQVTRNEGFFDIKTETGMLLKEGLRRGGNAPEYMATYAAGMWRAFQLGVTGVNGPLILSAAVGLCEQIYKSTLKDPHLFKSPAWPKALTTAITFMALAANILAAHRVAEAKVSPLSWPLKLQKLFGGTGSIAETILQVGKLVIREMFRNAERSPGDPAYGEIGVLRIASRYYFETIKAGARISDGLAILINGGRQAKAARESYEALAAKKNDVGFENIKKALENLPPITQTVVPSNAT